MMRGLLPASKDKKDKKSKKSSIEFNVPYNRLSKLITVKGTMFGRRDVHRIVRIPKGENLNEWLALHFIDFFNEIAPVMESLVEDCKLDAVLNKPGEGFPKGVLYLKKVTGPKGKISQMKVSVLEYINSYLDKIEETLKDETVFPSDPQKEYPRNFNKVCKDLYRWLFRFFVLMFTTFEETVKTKGLYQKVEASFRHFLFFGFCHGLMPVETEVEPIAKMVENLREEYDKASSEDI